MKRRARGEGRKIRKEVDEVVETEGERRGKEGAKERKRERERSVGGGGEKGRGEARWEGVETEGGGEGQRMEGRI